MSCDACCSTVCDVQCNYCLHVSVTNAETGQTLTGEEAPLATQLDAWLELNSG